MLKLPFRSLLVIVVFSTLMAVTHMYFFNVYLFDFSSVIPYWKIPLIYSLEAFIFALVFESWKKIDFLKGHTSFNLVLTIFTIASILFPILATVRVEHNEFFPIYAIPLHFIFTLVWISVYPTNFEQ